MINIDQKCAGQKAVKAFSWFALSACFSILVSCTSALPVASTVKSGGETTQIDKDLSFLVLDQSETSVGESIRVYAYLYNDKQEATLGVIDGLTIEVDGATGFITVGDEQVSETGIPYFIVTGVKASDAVVFRAVLNNSAITGDSKIKVSPPTATNFTVTASDTYASDECVSMAIAMKDSTGVAGVAGASPISFALTSSSTALKFYSDAACSTQITSTSFSGGTTDKTVYMQTNSEMQFTVTTTGPGAFGVSVKHPVFSIHVTKAVGSTNHQCVLSSGGRLRCWGTNSNGQLGINSTSPATEPTLLADTGITDVAASTTFTCVVKSTGKVACTGYNNNGQLGTGNTSQKLVLTEMTTLSGITQITTGSYSTCALNSAGQVLCWGAGNSGQLGNGVNSTSYNPVYVGGLPGTITKVSSGDVFTCALNSAGNVYCWGSGANGRIAQPSLTGSTSAIPMLVALPRAATDISLGGETGTHACAVLATPAAISCWGSNSNGQLGNGATAATVSTPVTASFTGAPVAGSLQAGYLHTCALSATDGKLYCWGYNNVYQLLTGTTTQATSPTVALNSVGLATWTNVALLYNTTCVISSTGRPWCGGATAPLLGTLGGSSQASVKPLILANWNVYITPAVSREALNECKAVTVQLRNGTTVSTPSQTVNVVVTAVTPANLAVYSDSGCTVPLTTYSYTTADSSKTIYVKGLTGATSSAITFDPTASMVRPLSNTIAVTGDAAYVQVSTGSQISASTCSTMSLSLLDSTPFASNPVASTQTYALTAIDRDSNNVGTFYSDSGCGTPVTSVDVVAGQNSTTFYFQSSAAQEVYINATFSGISPYYSNTGYAGLGEVVLVGDPEANNAYMNGVSNYSVFQGTATAFYLSLSSGNPATQNLNYLFVNYAYDIYEDSGCSTPLTNQTIQIASGNVDSSTYYVCPSFSGGNPNFQFAEYNFPSYYFTDYNFYYMDVYSLGDYLSDDNGGYSYWGNNSLYSHSCQALYFNISLPAPADMTMYFDVYNYNWSSLGLTLYSDSGCSTPASSAVLHAGQYTSDPIYVNAPFAFGPSYIYIYFSEGFGSNSYSYYMNIY